MVDPVEGEPREGRALKRQVLRAFRVEDGQDLGVAELHLEHLERDQVVGDRSLGHLDPGLDQPRPVHVPVLVEDLVAPDVALAVRVDAVRDPGEVPHLALGGDEHPHDLLDGLAQGVLERLLVGFPASLARDGALARVLGGNGAGGGDRRRGSQQQSRRHQHAEPLHRRRRSHRPNSGLVHLPRLSIRARTFSTKGGIFCCWKWTTTLLGSGTLGSTARPYERTVPSSSGFMRQ
ncbi:hypothetical protein D3C86_1364030 [compost metagenome]